MPLQYLLQWMELRQSTWGEGSWTDVVAQPVGCASQFSKKPIQIWYVNTRHISLMPQVSALAGLSPKWTVASLQLGTPCAWCIRTLNALGQRRKASCVPRRFSRDSSGSSDLDFSRDSHPKVNMSDGVFKVFKQDFLVVLKKCFLQWVLQQWGIQIRASGWVNKLKRSHLFQRVWP